MPAGCAFRERCNRATDICKTEPPLLRNLARLGLSPATIDGEEESSE